jgi:hypothetical protein
VSRSPEELLEAFRRKGGGWTLKEAEDLLLAFNFALRKTRQGHAVWVCGPITLTLTQERFLKRPYVSLILRAVERTVEAP